MLLSIILMLTEYETPLSCCGLPFNLVSLQDKTLKFLTEYCKRQRKFCVLQNEKEVHSTPYKILQQ